MSVISQTMERETLQQFLPHRGPMLLLERVEGWNDAAILCTARSHNAADNPLRTNGRVSTVHAMEYGAQAAAIHLFVTAAAGIGDDGASAVPAPDQIVFLGVVRDFDLIHPYLDGRPESLLQIESRVVSVAPRIFQYQVKAKLDDEPVAQGVISLIVGH